MSSNHETKMMDTESGGESTQYESIKTVTVPHSKEGGQLGEVETSTEKPGVDSERAEKTADNIRYGQNISESGMGGMTTTSSGTADDKRSLEEGGNTRTSQQYSAGHNVHDYNVGA